MKMFVVIGTIAVLLGVFIDAGPVFDGVVFGVAAVCMLIVAFGDQSKTAFFGSRWRYKDDPELSDAGYEVSQLTSLFLAVACIVVGIVEVTSQL